MRGPLASGLALALLAGCEKDDAPDDDLAAIQAPEIARVVPAEEALAGVHVPTLDPAVMDEAEIRAALATDAACRFRYTAEGRPVLAVEAGPDGAPVEGVVKLGGDLVVLRPTAPGAAVDAPEGAVVLAAGRARATLAPDGGLRVGAAGREADMVFEVDGDLRAGYRGYFGCPG